MSEQDEKRDSAPSVTVRNDNVREAVGEAVRAAKDAPHVTMRDESGRALFHVVRPRGPLAG